MANQSDATAPRSTISGSWLLVAMLALGLIAGRGAMLVRDAREAAKRQRALSRLTLILPHGAVRDFRLTPGGDAVLYVAENAAGQSQAFVRAIASYEVRPIAGTEGILDDPGVMPSVSPNGRWLAFETRPEGGGGVELRRVALAGGSTVVLRTGTTDGLGFPEWVSPRTLVLRSPTGGSLALLDADGGALRPIGPDVPSDARQSALEVLPGGRAALLSELGAGDTAPPTTSVVEISGGARRVLLEDGFAPRYLPSGQLVYRQGSSLIGVGFDPEKWLTKKAPLTLLDGLAPRSALDGPGFDLASNGTLVYRAQEDESRQGGDETRLRLVLSFNAEVGKRFRKNR